MRCTLHGKRFHLAFPYNDQVMAALRAIPGRAWSGEDRVWTVPLREAGLVRQLVRTFEFDCDDESRAAFAQADPDAAYHVRADAKARNLQVRTGWVEGLPDSLKAIQAATYRRGVWTVPADAADELATIVDAYDLAVHPAAAPILRRWSGEAAELRRLSSAEDADITIPNMAPGLALLPYQRGGVAYALRADKRTIIGDEPGLGKTVQCLATAEIHNRWPIIVVVPTVVEKVWAREIRRFFPHRSVRVLRGETPTPLVGQYVERYDYYVIGYPVLHCWQRAILRMHPQGVVFDEGHMLRNAKNLRTIAAKAIAGTCDEGQEPIEGAVPADGLALIATGTPILNKTAELIEQLAIIGKLHAVGGRKRMRARYVTMRDCETDEQRTERRRELNALMRATGCIVRRSKKRVLPELPPKRRSFVWVEPDARIAAEYRKAEDDLLEYLAERARAIAAEIGEDPESAAVMARMRASGAEALVRIGVLRQIAARAKMPAAREWAQQFLSSGQQLGVYAHHRAIVDELADVLDGRKIQGGMTPTARQDTIDGFQEGRYKVAVLSIAAAGVGITLTAASNALFLEYAWNPGTLTQAEDRHHRIGQHDSVNVYYLLAEGLDIDADMCDIVESKRSEVDNVTDGDDVEDWDATSPDGGIRGSVAAELLERMTRRALGRSAPAGSPRTSTPPPAPEAPTLSLFGDA